MVLFYVCDVDPTINYGLLMRPLALFGDFLIVQEFRVHFKLISDVSDDLVELVRDHLLLIRDQRGIRMRPFLLENIHLACIIPLILNYSSLYHSTASSSVPLGEREVHKAGKEDKVCSIEGIR